MKSETDMQTMFIELQARHAEIARMVRQFDALQRDIAMLNAQAQHDAAAARKLASLAQAWVTPDESGKSLKARAGDVAALLKAADRQARQAMRQTAGQDRTAREKQVNRPKQAIGKAFV